LYASIDAEAGMPRFKKKVHDDVGHYFETKEELQQEDLLSPKLFNVVPDMLAVMIEHTI
jgi:hypothetical protein